MKRARLIPPLIMLAGLSLQTIVMDVWPGLDSPYLAVVLIVSLAITGMGFVLALRQHHFHKDL